jgi:superoxide dismutase, Cu-Zn family
MTMRRIAILPILMLASCTDSSIITPEPIAVSDVSLAKLARADGSDAGVATLSQQSDGLWLRVSSVGLKPGSYGIHLHTVGKCETPDFTTAGAHWNPAGKMHGFENPMGSHDGDLRNLSVDAGGKGGLETRISGTLAEAIDADGLAIVIHEKPDDYSTDPSGNSGKRIICGAFERG